MITTAIMNNKGGTGKTITVINAAAILDRRYGQRVLLVDADSQANLTEFVGRGLNDAITPGSMTDLLQGKDAFLLSTKIPGALLLHADETLMALDVTAAGSGKADPCALANYLKSREDRFDRVLIDCPPAFSAAAMAALIAADEVVIPVKLDAFGIRGMAKLTEQIRNMRKINPKLKIAGVLPTMFYDKPGQRQAEEKLQAALARAGIRTFHHIRRSTMVDDSTFSQDPLIYCSPKSGACRDYKIFVRDLMGREGGEF